MSQDKPHLCTGALSPCGREGAAEHPPQTPLHASQSRGRGDRREQGPGSFSSPQVNEAALDLGSHSCFSRCLTGPLSCWQEGE